MVPYAADFTTGPPGVECDGSARLQSLMLCVCLALQPAVPCLPVSPGSPRDRPRCRLQVSASVIPWALGSLRKLRWLWFQVCFVETCKGKGGIRRQHAPCQEESRGCMTEGQPHLPVGSPAGAVHCSAGTCLGRHPEQPLARADDQSTPKHP